MSTVDCSYDAALREGGEEYILRWALLKRCAMCERPMRPFATSRAKWPATVTLGGSLDRKNTGSGVCAACAAARKRAERSARSASPNADLSRAEVAKTWSELERACAWQVASCVPDPVAAGEIIDLLGLFNADRREFSAGLNEIRGPSRL